MNSLEIQRTLTFTQTISILSSRILNDVSGCIYDLIRELVDGV